MIVGGWLVVSRVKVDERCLSDPLHLVPDRLRGLQVAAERSAKLELMTGLCSSADWRVEGRPKPDNSWGHRSLETQGERANIAKLS